MNVIAVLAALLLATPDTALANIAADAVADRSTLDHVWMITAAALVFLMQAGFLLLEAGQVRSKNSVNVAQKNLMDFLLSVMVFGAVGYVLMFGTSLGGLVGWDPSLLFFGSTGDWNITFFIFQLMFCGTAATILSGAVAERMAINGYLFCALLIGALIYPVAGHWVWGGLLSGSDAPLLAGMGFMDFAGSTVVHSVGAWVSLAAIIIIGPRIGKFDDDGRPRRLNGHSPVLSTAGVLILWVGWIGFNGGSVLAGSPAFGQVIVNTIIAGGAGGTMLMCIGRVSAGCFRPEASINGVLGGLVAITAGADVVTSQSAFAIGALAGVVVFGATWALETLARLDDPLGAIPVHGAAGAFGTLSVALFAPEHALAAGSRMQQIWVQLQGIGLVFAWSFGVSYLALQAIELAMRVFGPEGGTGLRVPRQHEIEGLNEHEHDAPMGTGILQNVMAELAQSPEGGLRKITLDYGDDAYETSVLFNRIIDNIGAARETEEAQYQRQKAERMAVEAQIATVVQACAGGDYSRRLTTDGKSGFLLQLCTGINDLSETTEAAFAQIGHSLDGISSGDLSRRMTGEFSGTLGAIQSALNTSLDKLGAIMDDVNTSVSAAARGEFTRQLEVGNKTGFFLGLCAEINTLCAISERGLSELFETLSAIGDGNLDARMSSRYEGRFAEIGDTVKTMAQSLADLMRAVQRTGDTVSQGSLDISRKNEEIRSRSQEQVASIGTAQDLLRTLVSTVRDMAENSVEADRLCGTATEQVRIGRDLAHQTTRKILEVAEAAEAISSAVERIESIARQSTMLSFNASVEAVRSVGAGHEATNDGFKVVAEEVRKMSQETARAAEEIRATTETVRAAVQQSADLVEQTLQSLNEINGAMDESAACVSTLRALGETQRIHAGKAHDAAEIVSERARQTLDFVQETTAQTVLLNTEAQTMIGYLSRFDGIDTPVDLAA